MIADHIGIHHAFIPVVCYVYILFYVLNGSEPNSERYAQIQAYEGMIMPLRYHFGGHVEVPVPSRPLEESSCVFICCSV
jgi:hypothetical protein